MANMNQINALIRELQQLVAFNIRFKDESWAMRVLNIFVVWFSPHFMTHFTTILGNTIYFPNRHFLFAREESVKRILTHEVVHLLDAQRWSKPLFYSAYLFPQILALGVFTFPISGPWALLFLVFLLPIPAPFRLYFESRAYAMDVLTLPPESRELAVVNIAHTFTGWDYYRMFPNADLAASLIWHWVEKAERGEDDILLKVLLIYEMVEEEGDPLA